MPGLGAAVTANRVGMGVSANPTLPPGAGGSGGSGMPRPSLNLNGAAENTGNPMASAIMKAIIGNAGVGGGHAPKLSGGKGASIRGLEKPTGARSAAISRRLNGNPSRGTELKGL